MARLEMPTPAEITAEQAAVCAEVIAGVRAKVPAPMIAWLRNPELARRGQRLGELLRFETQLDACLTELAILVCARHWTSHFEWTTHKAMALKAGVSSDLIAAIAARRPPLITDQHQQVVYEVSTVLLSTGRVPGPLYARGIEQLGERRMVELVGVLGYYCLVALTLNTFEIGLSGSITPEFDDPGLADHLRTR